MSIAHQTRAQMSRFEKGRTLALQQARQYGVARATETFERVIAANPGRPASDLYVLGLRAGLAEAEEEA